MHELSKLFLLKKDRVKLHGRLEELWTAATRTTTMIDGMPRAPFYHESKVEKYSASMADVKRELAELEERILQEECALQRFISTVPDSEIRQILCYRLVDCLSWRDVARKMKYAKATEESVKMAFSRFLKGEESSTPRQSTNTYKTDEKKR